MSKTRTGRAPTKADNPTLLRAAQVRSQSFDADANTVDLVWTTGAAVDRWDWRTGDAYREVLSLEPGAIRLERLNGGAPFLNTHSSYDLSDVIGSVVPGSARIEGGKGVATVKLSGAAADADTVGKIRDGVIRNVSVGYLVHAYGEAEANGVTTRTATDWEPLELSAVPIPADAGAQIRSHGGPRRPAPRATPRRVADIRRWARKAGLPKLGERHVRDGTTADAFFALLTERMTTPPEQRTMTKRSKEQDQFAIGRRWAEQVSGRAKRDDDAPDGAAKGKADQDDEEDEVCATCGRPLGGEDNRDDDADGDDHADDEGEKDDEDEDDKPGRGLRPTHGHRVRHEPGFRHVDSYRPNERKVAPIPHTAKVERADLERGAAEFRKLARAGYGRK